MSGLASRLKHQVILQEPQETSDGAGGAQLAWDDVATIWAEIAPLRGGEVLIAGRLQSNVTHRIAIRYREDVTAKMRLLYGARAFYIQAVLNPEEANATLELFAEEGV